jgi:alcohol dehydrogenase class IV
MRFEFATATRILFGPGTVREVPAQAAAWGRRALVVFDAAADQSAPLVRALHAQGLATATLGVAEEPTTDSILAGVEHAREFGGDVVIGIGGGSVMDTGKAIAALLPNGGEPLDYLEVIGKGKPLTQPSAPCIAIPTTAGTGAEVTRNAVLGSPEHRVKASLRSPYMLPRLAVVDPELTYSLPPSVTASTGLDALTQVIEPYVSNSANPMTDAVGREGMWRAARSLRRAFENGQDAAAREDMCIASLFGGLALANAKLGAVHGIAAPFGGLFHAPHGAICGRLLPYVMEANVRALQTRAPNSSALARFDEIARILTNQPDATAAAGVAWVFELARVLAVPPLAQYGLTDADLPELVAQSQKASSMKGNPIVLTDEEVMEIIKQAM